MKIYTKKVLLSLSVFLLSLPMIFSLSDFFINKTHASSDIEITVNTDEHTVISPFEKSARVIFTLKNNDTKAHRVRAGIPENEPPGGHVLAPVGYYDLAPGEEYEYVVVVEFAFMPNSTETQTFDFDMTFEWEGEKEEISTMIQNSSVQQDLKSNEISTAIKVTDSSTQEPINGFFTVVSYQSGMESKSDVCDNPSGICKIMSVSGTYLENLVEEYSIDHKYSGLILQVGAPGYKSYFDTNFLPKKGEEVTVNLEPLSTVGEYTLSKTIETDFSIWWIKASQDEKTFAFSQGTHGSPEIESPGTTKVTMADSEGNTLWQNEAGGECWGLDISPDGNYVAAGCHSGNLYVWDKDGNLYFQDDRVHPVVRWVKFSPDSKYLIAGPIQNTPELVGLYDLNTKEILYTLDIGSYLREARFSNDGKILYLASANGQLIAINSSDGSRIWSTSGGYYIPFILGLSSNQDTLIASGKGRAFRAFNPSTGEMTWETTVDQTITAGEVAEDGSTIANSVGGIAYGIDPDGEIKWARQYGGVGHNGVFYTRSGDYALFGGPNPTLFDNEGNVLWQREPGKEIQMTGPVEINTGGAYVTWVSSDGSLLILGGDDGNITFYKGSVVNGVNSYSQYTGIGPNINLMKSKNVGIEDTNITKRDKISLPLILGLGLLILAGIVILIVLLIRKRRKEKEIIPTT